jgi:hypothetical protein
MSDDEMTIQILRMRPVVPPRAVEEEACQRLMWLFLTGPAEQAFGQTGRGRWVGGWSTCGLWTSRCQQGLKPQAHTYRQSCHSAALPFSSSSSSFYINSSKPIRLSAAALVLINNGSLE